MSDWWDEPPDYEYEFYGNETLEHFAEMYGIDEVQEGIDLLYEGFFNLENTADERMEAREQFFDFMEMEPEEFDWDDWRDWYEAT